MLVRKIKNVEHMVYSNEEEFRQYCPDENLTRNWRDGTEGSWVMADDGQICQVLRRGLRACVTITLGQLLVLLFVGII